MVALLAKMFIKKDLPADRQRNAYGILCGVVGIGLNLLLFAGKFLAGSLSHSIAITADAFNNLSDAGSSVITLIGFRLAGQKPDPEHPFGHGRIEYLAGLAVSGIIVLMAYELIKSSFEKILHPSDTEFSIVILGILVVSILVKCYMAFFNTKIGNKIDSAALKATAADSLSDCIATGTVLAASLVGYFTKLHIDGYCGILVGFVILYAGISAAKDTINPLLGTPQEKELIEQIEQLVTSYDSRIIGVHDLMVHDYGPGRRIISLHAEVPAEGDFLQMHDVIDNIERLLSEKLGCSATIHMDPVVTSDEKVNHLKEQVSDILKKVDAGVSMHDFRVVEGETHTNLIFDVVVSFDFHMEDAELISLLKEKIVEQLGDHYYAVIKVDKDFCNMTE